MATLRYTLVGDGSSDRCLLPVINWALAQVPALEDRGIIAQMADLRGLEQIPPGLHGKIVRSFQQFPCEILFIHRDAERESFGRRVEEILEAAQAAQIPPHVPIVPVRMT